MTGERQEPAPTPTPIPVFNDNYVWAVDDGSQALVVDPGQAEPVAHWLESRGLSLAAVLISHHHDDHIGGLPALMRRWPGTTVWGPDDDRIGGLHHVVGDGDTIRVPAPALQFQVLAVPGHTRSHLAFHGHGLLFSGDTLFSGGCGRLFEGTPAQMHASLQRLAALPDDTQVCCGHEYTLDNLRFAVAVEADNRPLQQHLQQVRQWRTAGQPSLPSRIGLERAINPFLRLHQAAIRQWLTAHAGLSAEAGPVAAFAALRAAKDDFRG